VGADEAEHVITPRVWGTLYTRGDDVKTYATRRPGEPIRYEHARPFYVPTDWDALRGPVTGVVTLPLHLDWSSSNAYALEDPRRLRSLYSTVIQEATSDEDLERYLDGATLRREWRRLRMPPYVRDAWENAFPEIIAG
jgi:hypothetical protein